MNTGVKLLAVIAATFFAHLAIAQTQPGTYHEQYRLQTHFSPKQHWINDPNGMVYFNHTYHLFFQYYPGSSVWGPMHWGHATSTDLVHWKELPIALYPDSLGYIFSGSAVVDSNNTSGFGMRGKIPLVAIFTHHDPKGEKAGTDNFQNESLAYSLDNGVTWTKYKGNPVLKNPGIKDFRDPKVMWYAPEKKWVMTLATRDRVTFYSSPDLKQWKRESDFGKDLGAHGGVWECPDLFSLKLQGETFWVLIVNVNPGGPNGGSATQYFIGQFNGNQFTPIDGKTHWADHGPDEYAGVTWNNTGGRKIFLGWMSNWEYATQVPTEKWRNAMTIPRELSLKRVNDETLLASQPVREIAGIEQKPRPVTAELTSGKTSGHLPARYKLNLDIANVESYSITLSNNAGDSLIFGFDKVKNQYHIDRSRSGEVNFNKEFAKIVYAPRVATGKASDLQLIVDASSIEVFADKGLTVMTSVFFPKKPFDHLRFNRIGNVSVRRATLIPLKSIW